MKSDTERQIPVSFHSSRIPAAVKLIETEVEQRSDAGHEWVETWRVVF